MKAILLVILFSYKCESSRELHTLHPAFRNQVIMLLHECNKRGIEVAVQETYRCPSDQEKYRRIGNSRLKAGESRHQYGLAVDLIPMHNGKKYLYDYATLTKIGRIAEGMGLGWGGRWKHLYDPYHIEWKITTEELTSGKLPKVPETAYIPYD